MIQSKALAALLAALFGPGSMGAVTIQISPLTTSVTVSDSVTVDVIVNDVIDLFSFQADVSFDPGVLQASAVTEGTFLPTGGSTFFVPGVIDNVLGSISFTADSLIGAIAGVDGTGTLFSLDFEALAAGSTQLSISNIILLDSSFGVIDAAPVGGSVIASDVPEPGSVACLILGLSASAVLLRRRRRHLGG